MKESLQEQGAAGLRMSLHTYVICGKRVHLIFREVKLQLLKECLGRNRIVSVDLQVTTESTAKSLTGYILGMLHLVEKDREDYHLRKGRRVR